MIKTPPDISSQDFDLALEPFDPSRKLYQYVNSDNDYYYYYPQGIHAKFDHRWHILKTQKNCPNCKFLTG